MILCSQAGHSLVERWVCEGRRGPGVSGSLEVGRPGCVSLLSIFRAV